MTGLGTLADAIVATPCHNYDSSSKAEEMIQLEVVGV